MKISKQQLVDLNAPVTLMHRFITQTNGTNDHVEIASLICEEATHDDLLWVKDLLWMAAWTGLVEKVIRFACDCALINIEKTEPYCTILESELLVSPLQVPKLMSTKTYAETVINTAEAAGMRAYDRKIQDAFKSVVSAACAASVKDVDRLVDAAYQAAKNALSAGMRHNQLIELMKELFKGTNQ